MFEKFFRKTKTSLPEEILSGVDYVMIQFSSDEMRINAERTIRFWSVQIGEIIKKNPQNQYLVSRRLLRSLQLGKIDYVLISMLKFTNLIFD